MGDPGNAADTATGSLYGSVPYAYRMGKYDVTVGQYCQFLNAVAEDRHLRPLLQWHGLRPFSDHRHYPKRQFWQLQLLGHGQLQPSRQLSDLRCLVGRCRPLLQLAAKRPAHVPAGTPGEVAGSTETGAYTLNGANTNAALLAITRNAGATYFIPSENEWYKAAYYKGGSTNAGYWTYPTQSNTAPINTLPDTGNHANFYDYTVPGITTTPIPRTI